MTPLSAIHQVVGTLRSGSSISDYAVGLQAAFRSWGYRSTLYATHIPTSMRALAQPLHRLKPRRDGTELVLLHYSMRTEATEYVKKLGAPIILCYHNVTPPRYFGSLGGAIAESTEQTHEDLLAFIPYTRLALADSTYNSADLLKAGYRDVRVQPVYVSNALLEVAPAPVATLEHAHGTKILFVGRLAPNKRCEDLVKALYHYRQIDPRAVLFLVGSAQDAGRYAEWLRNLIAMYDLEQAVEITGHVTASVLAAYYRQCDVFLCMSEHEGFCIPILESMRFGLPVLAYDSTAVPETMGGAGILLRQKAFPVIAELIHLLVVDQDFRSRVIRHQYGAADRFSPERVLTRFRSHVDNLGYGA